MAESGAVEARLHHQDADGNWQPVGVGAANVSSGQVVAGAAATLVAARATRRSVKILNTADPDTDPTHIVYVGPATVTSANGMRLKPGESIEVTWVGLIQVLAGAGTPTVKFWDEYG